MAAIAYFNNKCESVSTDCTDQDISNIVDWLEANRATHKWQPGEYIHFTLSNDSQYMQPCSRHYYDIIEMHIQADADFIYDAAHYLPDYIVISDTESDMDTTSGYVSDMESVHSSMSSILARFDRPASVDTEKTIFSSESVGESDDELSYINTIEKNTNITTKVIRYHHLRETIVEQMFGDSDIEEEDDVYEVRDIMDHRLVDRVGEIEIEYYIFWKGYPMEESTWEPESNLTGCDELLAEYNCVAGL